MHHRLDQHFNKGQAKKSPLALIKTVSSAAPRKARAVKKSVQGLAAPHMGDFVTMRF